MSSANRPSLDRLSSDRCIPLNCCFPGHDSIKPPKTAYEKILAESLGLAANQPLLWSAPKPYRITGPLTSQKPIPFPCTISYRPLYTVNVPADDYEYYSHRLAQRGRGDQFALGTGNALVVGSTVKDISAWQECPLPSFALISDLADAIRCICWQSNTDDRLLVGTEASVLTLDVQENKLITQIVKSSPITALTTQKNGVAFSGDWAGTINRIDNRDGSQQVLLASKGEGSQVCGFLEPDGSGYSLIFGGNKNHIAQLDLRTNKIKEQFAVSAGVRALCRIPDSSDFLAGTGHGDKRVLRLNANLGQVAEYACPAQVRSIQAIGEHFLIGCNNARLQILDKNLAKIDKHGNHDLFVQGLAYDAENSILTVFSCDSCAENAPEDSMDTLTFTVVTPFKRSTASSHPAAQIR